MECLKCRRETQAGEIFCPECLTVMAASPVKQDTPVILPRRETLKRGTAGKKTAKPEEIIAKLRKKLSRLRIAVAVLSVLLALCVGALGFFAYREWSRPDLGSNYSTIATESTGSAETAAP